MGAAGTMDLASTRRSSAYDRLVDRYIDVTSWPTGKKSALVMSMAIPFQLVAWGLVALHADALADIIDAPMLLMHTGAFAGAVTLLFLVALPFARRGVEARWTIFLVILVYGSLCVQLIHLLGTANTTLLVVLPLTVLMVGLFFDRQAGWITIAFDTGLLVAVVALEMSGAISYAPVLQERSIDAQAVPAWISLHLTVVFLISLFVFFLVQLSVAARERAAEGEQMEPEDLSALLNEYLAEMAEIADSAGATVNQFVGDGIMIFFGAPESTSDRDHALRAVRMGLEMQGRMVELRKLWFGRGIQTPFRIRIGINTGVASVGDFGSAGRTTYSAIGNQTNLTARIQDHCEPGRVLISHSTWALIKEEIPCEERGEIQVKGLHYPIRVYEVADPSGRAASAAHDGTG